MERGYAGEETTGQHQKVKTGEERSEGAAVALGGRFKAEAEITTGRGRCRRFS